MFMLTAIMLLGDSVYAQSILLTKPSLPFLSKITLGGLILAPWLELSDPQVTKMTALYIF